MNLSKHEFEVKLNISQVEPCHDGLQICRVTANILNKQ